MRITIVGLNYEPEFTGIAPYTTGLARGLVNRGHQVHVLTGLPHYPEWRVSADYAKQGKAWYVEKQGGVDVVRFRHYVPRNPRTVGRLRMEASFGKAQASADWYRPDVVVAVSPALIPAAGVVARARATGVPVGVIVQDIYSRGVVETGAMSPKAGAILQRFETQMLNSATGSVVIHDRFADTLQSMGAVRDRITVIPNWTHVDVAVTESRVATRRRLGWSEHEIVALHAGNMGAKQDLSNVISAARLADRRGLPVRFVLVGDGNQRSRLEVEASRVDRVELHDSLPSDAYVNALAAADVLLVNERPGLTEMAVPSKLTSYFGSGRPIVAATDHGSATANELLKSGGGHVVPAGSPAQLLDAVWNLYWDPERSNVLGEAGRSYAHSALSRDAAIGRYEAWCSQLIPANTLLGAST